MHFIDPKGKKASFPYVHGAVAVDVINKRKLIGLLDFHFTVVGGNVDRLSCQVSSLQRPEDQKLENVNENKVFF